MASKQVVTEEKNARGIPKAPFITDVGSYLGDTPVEAMLRNLQDALAKYRFMDQNLNQRKQSLEDKIPDIKKTLSMVEFLQQRRAGTQAGDDPSSEDGAEDSQTPLRTVFELNDTLYAEAELSDTDTVYLWLGANVMLSYTLPDAVALLKSKLDVAQTSLRTTLDDLEFLREQITVMEVNTARVFNWDVKKRRELRERETEKREVRG